MPYWLGRFLSRESRALQTIYVQLIRATGTLLELQDGASHGISFQLASWNRNEVDEQMWYLVFWVPLSLSLPQKHLTRRWAVCPNARQLPHQRPSERSVWRKTSSPRQWLSGHSCWTPWEYKDGWITKEHFKDIVTDVTKDWVKRWSQVCFGQNAKVYGITDSDSKMSSLGGPISKAVSWKSEFWLPKKMREGKNVSEV